MKKPVFSTYKILKEKACNYFVHEGWAEWAIEMIEAGYESISLYQLAGISYPFDQPELEVLTDKVFNDLQLDYSDKRSAILNYTYYLVKSHLYEREKYFDVLRELVDLYYTLDDDTELRNFVLLYWTKDDLGYSDTQHYWEGATRTNIDTIISEHFKLYIKKFENND